MDVSRRDFLKITGGSLALDLSAAAFRLERRPRRN